MKCLFCDIVNKKIPTEFIYEDKYVAVFLDINPESSGHTLIVPKKHIKDFPEISLVELHHINTAAKFVYEAIIRALSPSGIKLVQNNGSFQEIPHYHLHLVPGYKKDPNLDLDAIRELLKKQLI